MIRWVGITPRGGVIMEWKEARGRETVEEMGNATPTHLGRERAATACAMLACF